MSTSKYLSLFMMMNQWVKAKQEGKNLSAYFEKEGNKNIATYGMNCTRETFFDEIEEMLSKNIDCPIISLEDILYEVQIRG